MTAADALDEAPAALLADLLAAAAVDVHVREVCIGSLTSDQASALTGALHPEEAAAVAQAMPRRRTEFAAGRAAAHAALRALGVEAAPLVAQADRAPLWPAGVAGSISHDEAWAVAAVARRPAVESLGIDIDIVARFDADLEPMLCAPGERARLLDGRAAAVRQRRLALIFCIKEAVYKAQYPLTGAWLDFVDLTLTLPNESTGAYTATTLRDAGRFAAGFVFRGRCAVGRVRSAAALVLRSGDLPPV